MSTDIYNEITAHLESCRFGRFANMISRIDFNGISADKSYFNNRKVTDHHALIPTINLDTEKIYGSLSEDERKVFDAITISLTAIFYPAYQYDSTVITVEAGGHVFKSSGTTIRRLGFKELYKNEGGQEKEPLQILPVMGQEDSIGIDAVRVLDRKTVPPKKYTDETIIKLMIKYGIGTPATRAEIIKKLQNPGRQFIVREKGKYSITGLGKEYIRIVPEELKSPSLTQHFEENLKKVNEGSMSKEDFLKELTEQVADNIKKFSVPVPDEERIGYAEGKAREQNENLGKCPHCNAEVKSGQYGIYCSGKCGMTLGKVRGKELTTEQVKSLLSGESILLSGLKKKDGSGTYSAYFKPVGIEEYSFTSRDGEEKKGFQFKFETELKKRKRK